MAGTNFQIGLPQRTVRTGQTTVYTTNDDGTYQKGIKAATRYVDNADGTISDRGTGLQWVKNVQKLIPGAIGVTSDNLANTAKGNWANNTSYLKGNLMKDAVGNKFYICLVDHTSVVDKTNWAGGTSYTAGVIKKDAVESTYWTAQSSHTSITDTYGTYATSSSYLMNDIIKDGAGNFYQALQDNTSIATPNSFNTGTMYNYGDLISDSFGAVYQATFTVTSFSPSFWNSFGLWSSGAIVNQSGTYYVATMSFSGMANFVDEVAAGYWTNAGTDAFYVERTYTFNSFYYSFLGSDTFAADRYLNGSNWSFIASHLFALDRTLNASRWASASNIYTFAADFAANPTYWRESLFTASGADFTSPANVAMSVAITRCEGLDFAGYTDWRLPNIKELESLVDYTRSANPYVNTTMFPGIATSSRYKSSTAYSANTASYSWHFVYSDPMQSYADAKEGAAPFLIVRGG